MAAKQVSPDTVIDLTLDSDNEQDKRQVGDVRKILYSGSRKKNKRAKTERADNAPMQYDDVEIIDPPITEDRKPAAATAATTSTPTTNHDGVEIVDAPAPPVAAATSARKENADEDLQVVGTKNEVRLPHNRCSCTTLKFTPNLFDREDLREANDKHCDLCYCYVCDIPAKDCKSWSCGIRGINHCNATDEHSGWVQKRHQAKGRGSSTSQVSGATMVSNMVRQTNRSASPYSFDMESDGYEKPSQQLFGRGPFEPGHAQASADPVNYPACVKCRWHNRLNGPQHNNLRCFKCGRVTTSAKGLNRGGAYKSKPTDYFLGTKIVQFRIIPSDVRSLDEYRSSWSRADKTDPAWKYDEGDMQEDIFIYRVGSNPTPSSILELVSEWDTDKLREKNKEGIVLDNPNDIPLLRVLARHEYGYRVVPGFKEIRYYDGDIKAKWQKEQRLGTFTIRLYLPTECSEDSFANEDYSLLLGCWFNAFPLTLTDLSGTIKAPQPNFNGYGNRDLGAAQKQKMEDAVTEHNKKAKQVCSALSLTSSCGNLDIGGITNNDNTLQGILKKFYKESFSSSRFAFPNGDWEKVSNHLDRRRGRSNHNFVLNHDDRTFAALCLATSAKEAARDVDSTKGLLEHLENIGHESEPTCDGLSIELLAFQKESLKWALERETIPGGIQSYFWTKVPSLELYYSPILDRFRKDKPLEVRGGIIAEEMGLGKTVISLALILKHPAPQLPISGSDISALATAPAPSDERDPKWDMGLYVRASPGISKRGSILSRGTLVICPVSLVGQWIQEAKSKLTDPGLLYPYHGQTRNRDANVLAKSAIVVTTYQVLASDDKYHRAKSSDPSSYCPPLEQVRWWRIICDEGHSLRQPNTARNRSISSLVADHKWLVTGTPVNTSIMDLKNQLKFIGIESIESMFNKICPNPRSRRRYEGNHSSPSKLLFFLRNVMMRHAQKQFYRGTKTTLMSLPAKTERSIEISLSPAERKEYNSLDSAAKTFYTEFKSSHLHELSSHYLKLSQKLTPMRVACSGGRTPLGDGHTDKDEDIDEGIPAARKKSEVQYSDFCFTAKFNVLIRELKRARDNDPTSKSLVFSQYNSTLNWLKQELPKHAFEFRTLSGSMSMKQRAKSLHDFQADPPTTIFLLSMRAGNCGINLTQANRVFLMEPGFNPALEQQAIGRVHRLGQKRKVEVVRLLVKDSVETRIHKFLKKKYAKPSSAANELSEDSEQEKDQNATGPVGNIATEKPKSKILAEEFDILFGVNSMDMVNAASSKKSAKKCQIGGDTDMPDSSTSAGFI